MQLEGRKEPKQGKTTHCKCCQDFPGQSLSCRPLDPFKMYWQPRHLMWHNVCWKLKGQRFFMSRYPSSPTHWKISELAFLSHFLIAKNAVCELPLTFDVLCDVPRISKPLYFLYWGEISEELTVPNATAQMNLSALSFSFSSGFRAGEFSTVVIYSTLYIYIYKDERSKRANIVWCFRVCG